MTYSFLVAIIISHRPLTRGVEISSMPPPTVTLIAHPQPYTSLALSRIVPRISLRRINSIPYRLQNRKKVANTITSPQDMFTI